jgi:predicted metal-dependent hydrolase
MSTSDQLVNAANVVNDALATMNQAKLVIEQLRREKAAMLEALERTLANFKKILERKSVRDASETIAEAEAAICLAKGE